MVNEKSNINPNPSDGETKGTSADPASLSENTRESVKEKLVHTSSEEKPEESNQEEIAAVTSSPTEFTSENSSNPETSQSELTEAKKETDIPSEKVDSSEESTESRDEEPDSTPTEISRSDSTHEQKTEQSNQEEVAPKARVEEQSSGTELSPEQTEVDTSSKDFDTDVSGLKTQMEELKAEFLSQLTKANQMIAQQQYQLKQFDGRIAQQQDELEKARKRIVELENNNQQTPYPYRGLVKQALEQQQASLEKDRQELNIHNEQVKQWTTRWQTLKDGIQSAVEDCTEKLSQCGEVKAKFPPDLQEKLQGRQKGLELIGKMLTRLVDLPDVLAEDETPSPELPSITEQEFIDLVFPENTDNLPQKAIDKKLKEVENKRWQSISTIRDLAEGRRKKWLNFVEKKVLPILDGIDEGERYSKPLVEELKANLDEAKNRVSCSPNTYSDWGETELDNWLRTYSDLRAILLDRLKSVKVYPMEVETPVSIDYNRHEPFDVQPDDQLDNECVKEVIREGYEYETETGKELLVLRSAQVVVVKNN